MLFGVAFSETLWDKLRVTLRRRLGSALRNAFDADDLTQDSLLVAFLKSDRFDNEHYMARFTHKVSRLQVVNHTRRQKNELLRTSHTAVELLAKDGVEPEEAYIYRELVALLAELAGALSPKEKLLLKLLVRGDSGKEICDALGISAKARNLLAFRLRQKLKQKLEEKGYKPDEGRLRRGRRARSEERREKSEK